jgi:polyphosphate glucokinase
MNILGVDIGGTHIKFRTQQQREPVKVPSGPKMTPEIMMAAIHQFTEGWEYDHVTIGYPGPVIHERPLLDPHNLGHGWVRFDFSKAFHNRPLHLLNDAAMQALGSYQGGRMLYLGLGTGLGSAMVVDGEVEAMELAHLPWRKHKTYEEYLGKAGLHRDGHKKWRRNVLKVIEIMGHALEADYVVLGGGNAKLMKELPANVILGSNENAFKGAFLIWKKRGHAPASRGSGPRGRRAPKKSAG